MEEGGVCDRCGAGPMGDGHLEVTSAPVLFWLDPDKSGASGVRMRVCLKCGHAEPYVDAEKLRRSAGL